MLPSLLVCQYCFITVGSRKPMLISLRCVAIKMKFRLLFRFNADAPIGAVFALYPIHVATNIVIPWIQQPEQPPMLQRVSTTMTYGRANRCTYASDNDENNEEEQEVEEHSDGNNDNDHNEDDYIETEEEDKEEEKSEEIHSTKDADLETATKKRMQCNKPILEDFVCSACQNWHVPRHWIYDCPDTTLTQFVIKPFYVIFSFLTVKSDETKPLSKSNAHRWLRNCFERLSICVNNNFCSCAMFLFC